MLLLSSISAYLNFLVKQTSETSFSVSGYPAPPDPLKQASTRQIEREELEWLMSSGRKGSFRIREFGRQCCHARGRQICPPGSIRSGSRGFHTVGAQGAKPGCYRGASIRQSAPAADGVSPLPWPVRSPAHWPVLLPWQPAPVPSLPEERRYPALFSDKILTCTVLVV